MGSRHSVMVDVSWTGGRTTVAVSQHYSDEDNVDVVDKDR